MRVIITEENLHLVDQYQNLWLAEQTAAWMPDGTIYLYAPAPENRLALQRAGAITHEAVEYVLIHKIGRCIWSVCCNLSHYFCNLVEIVVSLGTTLTLRSKEFWSWQKWT
jgi:hypothetical protein